jgi:hypothetical protein
LGFGCGYLAPDHADVLDAAYEAGIRHFDVARAYGRGLTEGMLGRFLRRHTGEITVTSKYGIEPPFSHPIYAAVRAIARPVLRRLRRTPALNARIEQQPVMRNRKASYLGADARASLQISLRNLRLERIDLFLMHEPEPADLQDPGLLQVLREERASGRIGAFGIGGPSARIPALRENCPDLCEVLQHEWTVLDPPPLSAGAFQLFYRCYGGPVRLLRDALSADPVLCRRMSDQVGVDLTVEGRIEQLMLNAAVQAQPGAIVLFSSTRSGRVIGNVQAATDRLLSDAALKLATLAKAWLAGLAPAR